MANINALEKYYKMKDTGIDIVVCTNRIQAVGFALTYPNSISIFANHSYKWNDGIDNLDMEEVTEQLITKSLLFETWREYEDVRET
jgi:hypothetical protein